jgi:hypothetical protein
MLKAIFITASLVAAVPCSAQQVRVITGDIEHIYGPDGQLLDDAKLRGKNQRAKRQEQRVKADLDQQRRSAWSVQSWRCQDNSCQQPPQSWWSVDNDRQTPKSVWSDPVYRQQAPKSQWSNDRQQPPKSQWADPNNQQPPKSQWSDPNSRQQPPKSAWNPG